MCTVVLSARLELLGLKADHSPPSSDEMKSDGTVPKLLHTPSCYATTQGVGR
jgi:hypothetical protein